MTKNTQWPIGPLSPSKQGKHYQLPPQMFERPDRITNSLSTGTYTAKRDLSYRGMDLKFPSKGGC